MTTELSGSGSLPREPQEYLGRRWAKYADSKAVDLSPAIGKRSEVESHGIVVPVGIANAGFTLADRLLLTDRREPHKYVGLLGGTGRDIRPDIDTR